MNYLKKIDAFLVGVRTLFTSAVLVAFSVHSAQAEDIEIYGGLSAEDSVSLKSEAKPNILFILDTSGSMGHREVILAPRPAYDPSITYSPGSGSGDNLYIYSASKTYTGMYVNKADGNANSCKAATDYIANNPNLPEYYDKAVVWQHTPASSVQVPNCTEASNLRVGPTAIPRRQWTDLASLTPVTPGSNYEFYIESSNKSLRFQARFKNSSGVNLGWTNICDKKVSKSNGETRCNSGTVPAGASYLYIRVYKRNEGATDASARLHFPTVCSGTTTVTTEGSADWQVDVAQDDVNQIKALECRGDNGSHGFNNADPEYYPQSQTVANTSLEPNYTTDANAGLVWGNASYPERYIVPGNYHDYLQASPELLRGNVTLHTINHDTSDSPSDRAKARDNYCNLNYEWHYPHKRYRDDVYISSEDEIWQCQTRMSILKKEMNNLLKTMEGVNVGIMRYNFEDAGSILSAVKDIDFEDDSGKQVNREKLIKLIEDIPASGSTPLQETLYEAYTYFAGKPSLTSVGARATVIKDDLTDAEKVTATDDNDYPNSNPSFVKEEDAKFITDPDAISNSADDTRTNPNYVSPIVNRCQDNNIILFSDGEPNRDDGLRQQIKDLSGLECGTGNGDCLEEAAYGLANFKVNDSLADDNYVYTHTIGFQAPTEDDEEDSELTKKLKGTSNQGLKPGAAQDSQHKNASNSDDLAEAFRSILLSINKVENDSFVAPAVSVNAFNRISNNDELYYAVFEPNTHPRWNGNVKKYKLASDGTILDANSNGAIDSSTGFFKDSARSIWSTVADGAEVRKGGFAKQLDFTTTPRRLYGITSTSKTSKVPVSLTESNFLDKINRITRDINGDIATDGTDIIIGEIASPDVDTNKSNIIKWTLGQDVELDLSGSATDPNYFVGESLHSTPSVVSFGTSSADDKSVIFAATNQGMLHAIDANDGEELWSYIPDPDLFKNLGAYFNRREGVDHQYGLDGEILTDIVRNPESKVVTKANLFMGQRRGGSKYFAIDVLGTSPKSNGAGAPETGLDDVLDENGSTRPKVQRLWTIDSSDTGFDRLGQTWAKPVPLVVRHCTGADTGCSYKKALVLAGGYDNLKYDDDNLVSSVTAGSPAKGNEIYIVERDTGTLLWKASSASFPDGNGSKMVHSFPSSPTVVDSDFDGVADLLFATDISGQVWRFDFKGYMEIDATTKELTALDDSDIITGGGNEANGKPSVIGGIIANLAEGGSTSRRFYNRLSVSLTPTIKDEDGNVVDKSKYNIVLGSGYRAHPLSEERYPEGATNPTDNHIYVIYDRNLQFPKPKVDGNGKLNGNVTYSYDGGTVVSSSDIPELTGVIDSSLSGVNYHGFHLSLTDQYEKVLNPSTTENFKIVTVTYTPNNSESLADNDTCNKGVGKSRVYVTDLLTGGTLSQVLQKPGLSAEPVIIVVDGGDDPNAKVLCIGTECFPGGGDGPPSGDGGGGINDFGLGEPDTGSLIKRSWWEEPR